MECLKLFYIDLKPHEAWVNDFAVNRYGFDVNCENGIETFYRRNRNDNYLATSR